MNLFDVASDADLDPKPSPGNKVKFFCPVCLDNGRPRRKTRNAQGYIDDPGSWWCYSCSARGTASEIAALRGIDSPRRRRRPKTVEPRNINKFWERLYNQPSPSGMAAARRWAQEVRGWDQEASHTAAGWPGWLLFDRTEGHHLIEPILGRHLVRDRRHHGLLAALRNRAGLVRTFVTCWFGDGPEPEHRRKTVAGKYTGEWSAEAHYGSIQSAVQMAVDRKPQHPVFFVEGLPDTVALWTMLALSGYPGEVVGTYNANASSARAVAQAFVSELAEKGLVADTFIVVQKDRPRVGGLTRASEIWRSTMIEVLSTRCSVSEISMTLLSQVFDPVPETLDVADWLKAGRRLDQMLKLGASPATAKPAQRDELRDGLTEIVREAINTACSSSRDLVVIQSPMGVGKTYATLGAAIAVARNDDPDLVVPWAGKPPHGTEEPPQQRRVLFTFSSHALANEKRLELVEHFDVAGITTSHLRGLLQHCRFKTSRAVQTHYATVGRRGICGDPDSPERCPFADTCPGSTEGQISAGEVAFGYHETHVDADLVIIDEDPGAISTGSVSRTQLLSLSTGGEVRRRQLWNQRNPDAGAAAAELVRLFDAAASLQADRVRNSETHGHGTTIQGEALKVALAGAEPNFMERLRRGYLNEAIAPPVPSPGEIRGSSHECDMLPSMAAWRAVRSLAAWLDEPFCEAGDPTPKPVLLIHGSERIRDGDTFSLNVLKPRELDNKPTIILDATAEHAMAAWSAAYPNRNIRLFKQSLAGRPPAMAIWLDAKVFSRRYILKSGQLSKTTPRRIRRAVELIINTGYRNLPLPEPTTIGIITHKPIADSLRDGAYTNGELRFLHDTNQQGRVEELVAQSTHFELSAYALELVKEGHRLIIGHYGRHEKGTNEFEGVDLLILIGDPTPNLTVAASEAVNQGLDPKTQLDHRINAIVKQALARARHAVRPEEDRAPVIAYAGARRPPPGLDWIEKRLPTGPVSESLEALIRASLRHGNRVGVVGPAVLKTLDDPEVMRYLESNPESVYPAVKRASEFLGLTQFEVATLKGSLKLYARTQHDADAWARRNPGAVP